jgi:pimeloyl-ACP methyl ester carboxylesterase
MTHVLVLLPGLMGSELWLEGELVWPGPPDGMVRPYTKLPQLLLPNLRVGDLIRTFSISKQYATFIDDLEACGFHEERRPQTLYICAYDWRLDIAKSAAKLADVVDEAFDQHHGHASITLVGHSLGGLVSRCYLESGRFVRRPGFRAVRQLIALAVPHRGAPLALTAALGQERRLFLEQDQVLQLVSDTRFPSLYQLLPPRGEPFVWDEQPLAFLAAVDVYDPAVASRLGLVPDNLSAARDFHATLDAARRPAHVRYFCFVGTRQTTISAVTLLGVDSIYRVAKVEAEDAGDGTVPVQSGTMAGVQSRAVGGEHGTIYKSDELRATLAALLGKPGALRAEPTGVEVAVRDRVARPGSTVRIALSLATPQRTVEGELRLERAHFDASYTSATFELAEAHPIRYSGLGIEKVGVALVAPPTNGLYRVAYYPVTRGTAASVPAGADELFVQAG